MEPGVRWGGNGFEYGWTMVICWIVVWAGEAIRGGEQLKLVRPNCEDSGRASESDSTSAIIMCKGRALGS